MSGQVEYESLFRSATMSLIQLFIPSEVAHATVSELGELGNVQFKDVSDRQLCVIITATLS
jgi:V-type H+-transporting ATPase subunit a